MIRCSRRALTGDVCAAGLSVAVGTATTRERQRRETQWLAWHIATVTTFALVPRWQTLHPAWPRLQPMDSSRDIKMNPTIPPLLLTRRRIIPPGSMQKAGTFARATMA